jgi:hypothetical protein
MGLVIRPMFSRPLGLLAKVQISLDRCDACSNNRKEIGMGADAAGVGAAAALKQAGKAGDRAATCSVRSRCNCVTRL